MNNETYGVKLEAFIKPFVDKIKQASQVSKQASDTIKNDLNIEPNFDVNKAKKRLKELEVIIKENTEYLKDFEKFPQFQAGTLYEGPMNDLKNAQAEYDAINAKIQESDNLTNELKKNTKETSENTKAMNKAWDKMQSIVKKNVNQFKRMTMSLIGVRSVYLMISRAENTYMSQDEELNQKMQASWAALGSILAPILEYMADLMLTFAKSVNYVVMQLTGVDYVARALNKTLGTTKKQLSSIDEITNLGENTPFENLEKFFDDIEINTEWLDKLTEVIRPIYDLIVDIVDFVERHPNVLAGLFAGFVATKIVSGLASIIGVAGGVTGLFGILTVLGLITDVLLAIEASDAIDKLGSITSQNVQSSEETREQLSGIQPESEYADTTVAYYERSINRLRQQLMNLNKSNWFGSNDEEMEEVETEIYKIADEIERLTGKEYTIDLSFELDDPHRAYNAWVSTINKWFGTDFAEIWGSNQGFLAVSKNVRGYDVGTNYVPNDQLAMIHEGEMIVPKAYNPNAGYTGGNAETNALLYDIAEMLSGRQSATFEIDGKEFARATYNEFENERVRLNTNTSFRRG